MILHCTIIACEHCWTK